MDSGDIQLLRIGPEATYGTTPSPATNAVAIPLSGECTFEFNQPRQEVKVLGLGDWNPSKSVKARASVQGDVPFLLDPLAHCFLLADLLGAPTTTGPDGSGVYTHVFKLSTPPVGATFETGDKVAALYGLYNGMRATKGSFKLADVGGVQCAWSYQGGTFTTGTSSLDASPTKHVHEPFDLSQSALTVKMGGSAVAVMNSLEFTVERSVAGQSFNLGGQGLPGRLALGKGPIKGTASFEFSSWSRFTSAKAGTETSFEIGMTLGTGLGTAGNESCTLLLPEVYLEAKSGRQVTEGIVTQDFAFWAEYRNAAESTALQITVKNTLSAIA